MRKPKAGLPSRQQILDFIANSDTPAGKREIARAFGLHAQDKIALKALLVPAPEDALEIVEVSPAVNSVRNNGPELLNTPR